MNVPMCSRTSREHNFQGFKKKVLKNMVTYLSRYLNNLENYIKDTFSYITP
jgi:hypothetical protein